MPEIALEALEFALVLLPLAMLVAAGSRHETRATGRTGVELLERHERFLDGAAHELRTPLTIARGHLEVLRRTAEARPEIDVALDELQRMERIIGRLLLLAEADRAIEAAPGAIESDVFLEDVFLRWSEVAPRAWQLGAVARGRLAGDAEAIRIALDALLENAAKYSAPHARITLSSRARGDMLGIEVRDEGIGIPRDALDSIFQRFARADPARGRGDGGFGLGLAIVDSVAKAHNGRCTVRSTVDGSTFTLELPGFEPDAAGEEAEVPHSRARPRATCSPDRRSPSFTTLGTWSPTRRSATCRCASSAWGSRCSSARSRAASRSSAPLCTSRGNGEEGVGEDVTYQPELHDAPPPGAGRGHVELDSLSHALDDFAFFGNARPADHAAVDYRRWAWESAVLDLALRQSGRSLGDVLG